MGEGKFFGFIGKQLEKIDDKKREKEKKELQEKIKQGREKGAKYLVITYDSFEMEEIYTYCDTDEELEKTKAHFNGHATTSVSKVIEINKKEQDALGS